MIQQSAISPFPGQQWLRRRNSPDRFPCRPTPWTSCDTVNYGISLVAAGMALRNCAIPAFGKGVTMGPFGMWILASAVGVARTGAAWPDVVVATTMAVFALQEAAVLVTQARAEFAGAAE